MESLHVLRDVETDRATIEAELSRLLSDKKFSAAPQMSAFLHYIISQTLEGNADRIKAYTVGVDALGKPPTFDAQSDPSVRVLALRLRKTLFAIYESSPECHTQVVLRVGTYVPEFFKPAMAAPTLADAQEVPSLPARENHPSDSESTSTVLLRSGSQSSEQAQRHDTQSGIFLPGLAGSTLKTEDHAAFLVTWKQALFVSFIFLFLWLWHMSGPHNNVNVSKLAAGISMPAVVPEVEVFAKDSTSLMPLMSPTLYLVDGGEQSRHLRQVSMLVGSSVVQNGNLNVVRISKAKAAEASSPGDYHMVLNELLVGGQSRVDAQVVRPASGAIVASATMMFDNTTAGFNGDEVLRLERLATSLSDAFGPLYTDFCITQLTMAVSANCDHREQGKLPATVGGLDAS